MGIPRPNPSHRKTRNCGGSVASIHRRDRAKCWLCQHGVATIDASRDHLRPRGEGGFDKARNYRLAHRQCNSARGRLPVADVIRVQAAMLPCTQEALCEALRAADRVYRTTPEAEERARPRARTRR